MRKKVFLYSEDKNKKVAYATDEFEKYGKIKKGMVFEAILFLYVINIENYIK